MKEWLKKNWVVVVIFILSCALLVYSLSRSGPPPIVKSATVTLQIQASPDFILEVTPASILTFPNRTVPINAMCTSVNQFAGDITISVGGLPPGVTAQFSPGDTFTLGPNAPKGVHIDLVIPADESLVGTHIITITATSTNYN